MNLSRTVRLFALFGFAAGAGASALLWIVTGPEYHPAVLGFRGLFHFFVFPFISAGLAAAWAYGLQRIFPRLRVGIVFGLVVAALSFVSFTLLLSVYVAGPYFLEVFPGFTFFGGILLGWALLLLGATAGWAASRYAAHP